MLLGVTILCVFDNVVHAWQKLYFVDFVNQVTYYFKITCCCNWGIYITFVVNYFHSGNFYTIMKM